MERGMESGFVIVSHHLEAATVRNIYAPKKDPVIPQRSPPLGRTADVVALEEGKYGRTRRTNLGVEREKTVDVTGIGAVLEWDTPAAMAENK